MGKGQLGPFGSDRPTSCSTRMDPTVNGNNDECFFSSWREKKDETRDDLQLVLPLISFLLPSKHPLENGKSTRFEQKILVDLLILEQRSCWWSVSMEITSWSGNVFPISFSSSQRFVIVRSFLFSRNYHIRVSHRENKQFFSTNSLFE